MDKFLILIWLWFLGTGEKTNNIRVTNDLVSADVVEEENALSTQGQYNYEFFDLITEIDSTKTCIECHSDMLEGENVHSPAKKDCQRCHITNGTEHPLEAVVGFNLKTDVPNLCYECHDSKTESEFVHDPIKKGDCLICHDIHNSPNIYLVKKDPVAGLCLDCHELNIPEGNMIHGAVTEGNCVGCHNPHEANNDIFLNTNRLDRLCRSCHKSIRTELKMEFIHDPFMKKDCFSCHNGHSSKESHLSDLVTRDLCLSCHEETHNSIQNASLVHQAVNVDETCINCHTPHASAEKGILLTKEKELCLSCHKNAITTDSTSIVGIGQFLKEGNTIHGAIEENGCSICHQPHVSEEHNLLSATFPMGSYASAETDNFALCFECHNETLFASPIDTLTNFRNEDNNLHYAHIKGNKGRNCNLCHNMHGASNKHLIDDKVMFGNWEMPINYQAFENGGSCAPGCHEEKKYIRHELPDSLNIGN